MKYLTVLLSLGLIIFSGCSPSSFLGDVSKQYNTFDRLSPDFWSNVHTCAIYINSTSPDANQIVTIPTGENLVTTVAFLGYVTTGGVEIHDYFEAMKSGHPYPQGSQLWATGGTKGFFKGLLHYDEKPEFDRRINDYFKNTSIEEPFVKLLGQNQCLPSKAAVNYEIIPVEDPLSQSWKEADTYVILDTGGLMIAKEGLGTRQLSLVLITEITILPKSDAVKWKTSLNRLMGAVESYNKDEKAGFDELQTAACEYGNLKIFRQIVYKESPFLNKNAWVNDNGKVFNEQFRTVLASLTEEVGKKICTEQSAEYKK